MEIPIYVIAAGDDDKEHCVRCGSTRHVRVRSYIKSDERLCIHCATREAQEYEGSSTTYRDTNIGIDPGFPSGRDNG